MGILKKIEDVVKKTDFFYSKEMLRYDEDEDYKTLTGGIISLGIIIAIVVGFASMILSTLNRTSISTTVQVIKNTVPPASLLEITPESSFRFGVQIWHFNLSDSKRYFDLTFEVDYQTNGVLQEVVYIPLETCTKEYFADYPSVVNGFQKLGVGGWLCPPLNTTLNLYGKYSSQFYSQYIIKVAACNNDTDPSRPCASPEQIQALFDQNQNFFYFTLYFTNPQINPDEKDYKSYYLEDMSYVIFGSHVGSETFVYFTDYTVTTDDSIWPYEHVLEDKGCIVQDLAVNHPFETNINGIYATFNLVKSPDSIVYTRQVQKLSTVFSFIGGMIGAVSAVLFILKIYTNLAFEFSISMEIFKKRVASCQQNQQKKLEKGSTVTQLSMNLFNFVKYYVFAFSKLIGNTCDWPAMKYAEQCKQQISKQLDIRFLLKRIIFLEHCITHMIQDYQLDALQMSKPLMPSEIKAIREKCQSIIDSEDSEAQQSSASQIKQKPELVQIENCIKNQNNLTSPSLFVDNSSNNLSVFKSPNSLFKPKKCSIDVSNLGVKDIENEIAIVDIENKVGEQELFPYLELMKRKGGLRVANSNVLKQKQYRRSSYLMQLQKSALEGNHISSRIWKEIDKTLKKIQPDD